MANEWSKTAFVEFEAMLRRRLRSGAAPVAACAGFDLDDASAYLEGALGGSHRAGYESHLAGCATCRRHLIELSRLAQTVPRVGTQAVTVKDQTPAWVRCREIVAGWFDLSTWNLKWQMVGVAGAAFAILIAALGAQSWRRTPDQVGGAVRTSATPPISADLDAQQLQSPAPEPSPLNEEFPASDALIARQEEPRASVPKPEVVPINIPPTVANAPSNSPLNVETIEALPPNPRPDTQAETRESRDSAPSPQIAVTLPAGALHNISGPYRADLRAQAPDLADRSQGNEIAARITPRLPIEAANTGPKATPTPGKKPSAPFIPPKGVRRALTSLVPFSNSDPKPESDRKAKVDDSNDESSKTLIWRMRDKVFRFERDMWIDQEYKPEMQEWRVFALPRGSEEYKR
ncbi:MAG: zf-HC2 domain-containing protein, partial [Blastocatellia bacterium]